jgi:hypothetical protein
MIQACFFSSDEGDVRFNGRYAFIGSKEVTAYYGKAFIRKDSIYRSRDESIRDLVVINPRGFSIRNGELDNTDDSSGNVLYTEGIIKTDSTISPINDTSRVYYYASGDTLKFDFCATNSAFKETDFPGSANYGYRSEQSPQRCADDETIVKNYTVPWDSLNISNIELLYVRAR